MHILRTITAPLLVGCLSLSILAKPAKVSVEAWADRLPVSNLDMTPDGERMAMLMVRERGGDPELMIFDTDDIKGSLQAIQPEGLIPQGLRWANNDYLVVNFYFQMEDAGRTFNVNRTASYNVNTKEWTSLIRTSSKKDVRNTGTNIMGRLGSGSIVNLLVDEPYHVIVSHNEERGKPPNYYKVDIRDGKRNLVYKGNSRFAGIIWDREGNARGAQRYDSDGPTIISMARVSSDDEWKEIGELKATSRDRFDVLGFYNPKRPYLATVRSDKEGGNYTAIFDVDIRTGQREIVFEVDGYDSMNVLTSPRLSDGLKVVGYTYFDKKGIQPYYTDEVYGPLHYALQQAFPKLSVRLERVSDDGKTTLISTRGPEEPGKWYLFKNGRVVPIISASTEINAKSLSPVKVISYKARDGLKVSAYVTIPDGMDGPFPTIAMPHGGPWVRDTYSYDKWAQMLANRGYAVFQPNYRGSTFLGKDFWLAGDNKWGHEMQNDIDDGMKALVKSGIADPEKLAMFGWSYGGYAAFVAATREEHMYNCIVSGAGVSDLTRIRGGLNGSRFAREFQKPTISGVSPVDLTKNVKVPMLIVHGDIDTTVPVEHSRRFVEGLEAIEADFEYIEIEGMAHSPIYMYQNMQWFPQLFEFFDTKCSF